jgi:hypothetical protein
MQTIHEYSQGAYYTRRDYFGSSPPVLRCRKNFLGLVDALGVTTDSGISQTDFVQRSEGPIQCTT